MAIANLRDTKTGVKCDRSSVLGNPFFMKSEDQRDAVCDGYQRYFDLIVNENMLPFTAAAKQRNKFRLVLAMGFKFPTREQFLEALATLKPEDTLLCWCHPKRCHCETIQQHLLRGKSQSPAEPLGNKPQNS